eukprot:TRINITY_DN32863_c0_g3_i1.p1 TRINITY_DN32863_c0_g3~~TRINITY_DN32863_c0_g3_i1.p1  ORF type:complete len:104 (-),score=3.01 TRINITY_DN32863_c0_g3_i1:154-465(-)
MLCACVTGVVSSSPTDQTPHAHLPLSFALFQHSRLKGVGEATAKQGAWLVSGCFDGENRGRQNRSERVPDASCGGQLGENQKNTAIMSCQKNGMHITWECLRI